MFSAVLLPPVILVNFLVTVLYLFFCGQVYFVNIYLRHIFYLTVLCMFITNICYRKFLL